MMQAWGGACWGAFSRPRKLGHTSCPPSFSISGPEPPGRAARCAYSPLRVPGMSQWCPSQRHDSTTLASIPPLGRGVGCGGDGGAGPGRSPV